MTSRTGGWRSEDVLGAVAAGAVLAAVWPTALALQAPGPPHPVVWTAHLAGMLAGYGVVVLVALMSRHPALERGLGADRIARWHAAGGRAVVGLVLLHAWAATAAWADTRGTGAVAAAWDLLGLPGLLAAAVGTVLLLAVAALSVRAARRRVSHETWHGVHLLVYAAVALSFTHQLAGPDLAGHRWLQVLWALLYTGAFGLVLEHRVLTPLRGAARHRTRVAAVHAEAPGVVSIVVEGQHLEELQAEAGQFFRWRFLTPDLWRTAHPFSLSAPPTGTHLRLTVKDLGDGSARLQDVEPGTWVVAEGPYGALTERRRTRPQVLLLAGGVGVTPLRALFETLACDADRDVLLLCFARTEQDLLFRDELDALAAARGARVRHVVGDVLDEALLRRLVPDAADRDVYLCGPPGMSAAARDALRALGVPGGQVHEERFAL